MFENFKEKLHSVQQDFSTGFKTLGDKSKESKILRKPRTDECLVHFSAGLHILSGYEESWYLLHRRTKDCAEAAELVDGDIVMLSAVWDKRRSALTQLEEQLQGLPALITDLDTITANLAQLEGDFEEMESRLVYLETVCCQCDQQSIKLNHAKDLENYKKKKRKELHALEVELHSEHTQKVSHMEQKVKQVLKERQKVYEEAFHQDVEKYLSTGFLTHREPSSADTSVLDQITVTNTSDLQALDDFLNSSSEDLSSSTSGWTGPEVSMSSESPKSSETPSPSQQRTEGHVQRGQGGQEGQEEEQSSGTETDEPLVEADEEDIQADLFL